MKKLGHTWLPNEILVRLNIPANEKLLLVTLTMYAGHNGICFPSHKRLAQIMCLGDRQVKNILNSLTQKGLVRTKRNPGRTNNYFVYPFGFTELEAKGRKPISYPLGSAIPINPGSPLPTKNSNEKKEEKDIKAFEEFRKSLESKGIIRPKSEIMNEE